MQPPPTMKIEVTDSQDVYPMLEPKDFAPPGGPGADQFGAESLTCVGEKGDGQGLKAAEAPKGKV